MDAVRCVKQASGDVTTHLVDITGAGEFKLYNEGDNTHPHPTVKFHLAVLPRRRARLCSHLHRVHYNERDTATTSTAAFTIILSRSATLAEDTAAFKCAATLENYHVLVTA